MILSLLTSAYWSPSQPVLILGLLLESVERTTAPWQGRSEQGTSALDDLRGYARASWVGDVWGVFKMYKYVYIGNG